MCLKTQNEKATLSVPLRVFGQEFREGPLQKSFIILPTWLLIFSYQIYPADPHKAMLCNKYTLLYNS